MQLALIRAACPPQLLHTRPLSVAFDLVSLGTGRLSGIRPRCGVARRTVTKFAQGKSGIGHPQLR